MLRSLFALLVLVATAGCSLVNPLVVGPKARSRALDPASSAGRQPLITKLDDAKKYARWVKDEYRGALGDQAKLQSWLGIGLIPLSAAAIGIGASGGPANAVLATGLAGAAGFGAGMWLINKPHQLAYVAGIKAVTCAVDAVEPLGEIDESRLDRDLGTLRTQIPLLEQAIASLAPLTASLERDLAQATAGDFPEHQRLLNDAKAQVAAAMSLLTSAKAAETSGLELQYQVSGAGARLANAIDRIADAVDGMIVETQRDPQALASIINGLGANYTMLTAVPEAVKPPTTDTTGGDKLIPRSVGPPPSPALKAALDADRTQVEAALLALRNVSATVDAARRQVAAAVNHVDVTGVARKLDGCGVNARDIVTALTLDPAGPFPLGKGSSTGFVAKGGVSPYWATIHGPGTGVTVTPAGPASSAFVITSTGDAPSGTYVVTVIDGTGKASKQADVVVGGADKSTPGKGESPAPSPTTGAPKPDDVAEFARHATGKVIGVPGSGVFVKIGSPAARDKTMLVPLEVDRVMNAKPEVLTTDAVVDALRTVSGTGMDRTQFEIDLDTLRKKVAEFESARAAACASIVREDDVKPDSEPLFSALKPESRKTLQRAVCAAPDGAWGKTTKQNLKKYQCQTGRMPDGTLNNETVSELLKMTAADVTKACPAP